VAERKANLTVLFADLSDSTRLYETLGDTKAFGSVREVISLLKSITDDSGGRVVKSIGDGLMCAFPVADAAASAAGEMQRRIAQLPPLADGRRLTIRVGFHFGPVIQDGEDVFGDCVNVAARMAGLALAGQVITTGDTIAALSAPMRESVRRIDALPVKGKAEEVEVHELMWHTGPGRTVIPGRTPSVPAPGGGPRITLIQRGREQTFKDTVYFGREAAGNHLVFTGPLASRRHAKIELRGGKFVLVDQSSNGTFVTLGNHAEMKLRREEAILYGSGVIALGESAAAAGEEAVAFHCEPKP